MAAGWQNVNPWCNKQLGKLKEPRGPFLFGQNTTVCVISTLPLSLSLSYTYTHITHIHSKSSPLQPAHRQNQNNNVMQHSNTFCCTFHIYHIIIIIIIIIALKGIIHDLLQSPQCAMNHLQHVRSSGLGAIACKEMPKTDLFLRS